MHGMSYGITSPDHPIFAFRNNLFRSVSNVTKTRVALLIPFSPRHNKKVLLFLRLSFLLPQPQFTVLSTLSSRHMVDLLLWFTKQLITRRSDPLSAEWSERESSQLQSSIVQSRINTGAVSCNNLMEMESDFSVLIAHDNDQVQPEGNLSVHRYRLDFEHYVIQTKSLKFRNLGLKERAPVHGLIVSETSK